MGGRLIMGTPYPTNDANAAQNPVQPVRTSSASGKREKSTRRTGKSSTKPDERVIQHTIGNVTIEHTESWCDVILGGFKIHLRPKEAEVLHLLVEGYGEPLTIQTLHHHLGMSASDNYLIARYIRHLRSKLARHGLHILDVREYDAYVLIYFE
jgi:DNA-binding response OmpR family regulator